jgi:hypothetical protein
MSEEAKHTSESTSGESTGDNHAPSGGAATESDAAPSGGAEHGGGETTSELGATGGKSSEGAKPSSVELTEAVRRSASPESMASFSPSEVHPETTSTASSASESSKGSDTTKGD